MSTFTRAAEVQRQVIGALMLRDMLVQTGLTRLGIAWLLVRPLLVIIALYFIYSVLRGRGRPPQGMDPLVFLISGYLIWLAFSRMFADLPNAMNRARGLMMFPHVTYLDIAVSRAAINWAIYSCVFFTLSALGVLFEQASLPEDAFGVVMGLWCSMWLGACLGVIMGVIERFTDFFSAIMQIIRRVGVFVSGALFAASTVPSWILGWISWNPVLHCLEIARESWWPAYISPVADPVYVAQCMFFMTALALLLERTTRRWAGP